MSPRRTRRKRLLVAPPAPPQARGRGRTLQSATVGALPILNRFLGRMRLEDFLRAALPKEDRRTKLSPVKALLLLVRNVLISQGRFVTVLPRTRSEDAAFRDLVRQGQVTWQPLWAKTDEEGNVLDRFLTSEQPAQTAEGYSIDDARVAADAKSDGIFPLVTNVLDLSPLELLRVYKRQPTIEKRFAQLKTDFEVAPVYLKSVHRIQALLCVYFLALLVEALLERELRQAMRKRQIEALPMYPEGRACRWPTARRVIDLFESVQRHTLLRRAQPAEIMVTELTRLQRRLLNLLGRTADAYGR